MKKPLQQGKVLPHLYLLSITMVGFILFDAASMGEAVRTCGRLFGIGTIFTITVSTYYSKSYAFIIVIASILATPLLRNLYGAAKNTGSANTCAPFSSRRLAC